MNRFVTHSSATLRDTTLRGVAIAWLPKVGAFLFYIFSCDQLRMFLCITVKLFFTILFELHFNAYLWSNLKRSAIKIPAKRHEEDRGKDCHKCKQGAIKLKDKVTVLTQNSILNDFENRVSRREIWELKFWNFFEEFLLSIQENVKSSGKIKKFFSKNAKSQVNQLAPVFFRALKLQYKPF